MDETDQILEALDLLRRKAPGKIGLETAKGVNERSALRSKTYARIASSAYLHGSTSKALELITNAINILPSAELYAKRSVIHLALGNHQLAAGDATCAIGFDQSFPSGYLSRALALIHLGDYEIALNDLSKLRKCLANSKRCNKLYVRCRNMYWDTGRIEPFEIPQNISENAVNEDYSAFAEEKVNVVVKELSSSGVIESSKLNEQFVKKVIETYKHGLFHLYEKQVFMILKLVLELLKEHSNIVSIEITEKQELTIVGDLRGNFDNLMNIFRNNHSPQFGRPYLFNGNIIGEYRMSLPCIVIILCLKILFPEDVFIARGHEECLERCELNGFENEVLTVYDEEMMKGFTEVFNWLPVAHVLNNAVLIVHGGLFEEENISLADVQEIKRHYQPPDAGPLCDILYSDPWNSGGISKKNRLRGVWFGPDVTRRFCNRNYIDYIIRSHYTTNVTGYEVQSYHHCVTINSSTPFASYLVIKGNTKNYDVVHGRRKKGVPKNCGCWTICNCHKSTDAEEDPLHGYNQNMKLDLIDVPREVSSQNSSTLSNNLSSMTITNSSKAIISLQKMFNGVYRRSELKSSSSTGKQKIILEQTRPMQLNDASKILSQSSNSVGVGLQFTGETIDSGTKNGKMYTHTRRSYFDEMEGEGHEDFSVNMQVADVPSNIESRTSLAIVEEENYKQDLIQQSDTGVSELSQTASDSERKIEDQLKDHQSSRSQPTNGSVSRTAHWLTIDPTERPPSLTHSMDDEEYG